MVPGDISLKAAADVGLAQPGLNEEGATFHDLPVLGHVRLGCSQY